MGFRHRLIQGFPLCPFTELFPLILHFCFHRVGFILRSHVVAKCPGHTVSRKEGKVTSQKFQQTRGCVS